MKEDMLQKQKKERKEVEENKAQTTLGLCLSVPGA